MQNQKSVYNWLSVFKWRGNKILCCSHKTLSQVKFFDISLMRKADWLIKGCVFDGVVEETWRTMQFPQDLQDLKRFIRPL